MGLHHVMQLDALDHILFVLTISGMVLQKTWKHAVAVTSCFAFGHTISMWLGMHLNFPTMWIEFLIAATIVVSGLWTYWKGVQMQPGIIYFVAMFIFGCVHGLGFANAFEMMLPEAKGLLTWNHWICIGIGSNFNALFVFDDRIFIE